MCTYNDIKKIKLFFVSLFEKNSKTTLSILKILSREEYYVINESEAMVAK